eukprot:CAMPEP_0172555310 /NCGR_PEP_ID=MMETSP1067-20121228/58349_1 /TAXON_ID=265564 ORGANISM="Thalassiosira punctigera, Strain Tpunct2005C2" /NCGR_SAMPLE_ID=MMETSP1067 /ASSEMBLY_ACC=CAM_ASM_000444 /LENGTH=379 /DNA_ID=CAMNT_0013343825 /DNA_START=83 /DNA_END=1219 /DNA_ORIENTATION=+
MSGGFKFDFSPSGEGGEDDPSTIQGIADANDLIARLTERSEKNAGACTLVNASSQIFSGESKPSDHGEFKPHLRFHSHESIDLRSGEMDGLRYVKPKHMISDDTTDLIPGVYEGGLKVWECSVDLCRFLARVIDDSSMDTPLSTTGVADLGDLRAAVRRSLGPGGSTMELGCGHGLPGCLILRENIRRTCKQSKTVNDIADSYDISAVIFADFNDFVLHHATIPNAQLNVCGLRGVDGVALDEFQTAKALVERSVFAGGEWMGLSHKLSSDDFPLPSGALLPKQKDDNRLDLILASETTYTPESCEETAFLLLKHLKIDEGVGLVATKRFYFGVGGGTDLFKSACDTLSLCDEGPHSGLRLSARIIQSYDTGNANIRDL